MDSHEAGSQNWTPGFEQEFLHRKGYDMRCYLPAMMGYIVVVGDRCVERHSDSVVSGDDFQRTPEIGFLHVHLKVSLMIIGYGT